MDKETEKLARSLAVSSDVNWSTNAPFEIVGDLIIKKEGFANIPRVGITIACKDFRDLVTLSRQFVYREIEEAGIPNEALGFTPTIGTENRSKRYLFNDCNESSPTLGKRKYGFLYLFNFEINKEFVGRFEWGGFCNSYGKLPEYKSE